MSRLPSRCSLSGSTDTRTARPTEGPRAIVQGTASSADYLSSTVWSAHSGRVLVAPSPAHGRASSRDGAAR
jgi:hypothetical protein